MVKTPESGIFYTILYRSVRNSAGIFKSRELDTFCSVLVEPLAYQRLEYFANLHSIVGHRRTSRLCSVGDVGSHTDRRLGFSHVENGAMNQQLGILGFLGAGRGYRGMV